MNSLTVQKTALTNSVSWLTARGLRFCLAIWLLQRILLQTVGVVAMALLGPPVHVKRGFFGTYFDWDSGWFACIAQSGYFGLACADGATTQRFAFFPLYPLASRGLAWLIGLGAPTLSSLTVAMWLVSAVASLVAIVGLYQLAAATDDEAGARRSVVLFAFGPYAIFLVASYSESLYLAAAITAWLLCVRGRYLACGLVGIAATATRASGVFLVPALLVLYVTRTRRSGRPLRLRELLAVAVSSLGALGYWIWLAVRTGDPLAWSHAQTEGWHRRTRWPWDTLLRQGIHVLREPRGDWQVQAVLELVFAVLVCLGLVLLVRRRKWAGATLVGLTAVSLMTSNSYLSLARNTLTLFPLVLLLAQLTAGDRHGRRFWLVLGFSVALLVFNSVQLALGRWAD